MCLCLLTSCSAAIFGSPPPHLPAGSLRLYMVFSLRSRHSRHSGWKSSPKGQHRVKVYRLKKTVALIGMMGSGKTAIGTATAKALGVPFLDSDAEIEAAANMTVPEIFERFGEPFFRDRETQVVARLLEEETGIVSTGGGAYLDAGNRAMISQKGVAVWLRADLPLLWSRVRHKDTRPLLRTADPRATLAALLEARTPLYAEADLVVDASPDYSIEDMTGQVIAALLTRPDVLERETE